MATVNGELLEAGLFRALAHKGISDDIASEIVRMMVNDVLPDIAKQLQGLPFNSLSANDFRMIQLKNAIENGMDWGKVSATINSRLRDSMATEAGITLKQLNAVTPSSISFIVPGPDLLMSLVMEKPFNGKLMTDWFSQLGVTVQDELYQALRVGMVEGKSIPHMAADLLEKNYDAFTTGGINKALNNAKAVVRTAANMVLNRTREAVYEANSDVISAVEYVATLDDRTTFICMELHGKVFPIGEGERPPQHYQCFIDGQVPIYTSKGWKKIREIKKSDLVLTHKGRFKKVTEIFRTAKQSPVVYSVYPNGFHSLHKRLTVTEGHPIMINEKWMPVENIKPGDKISFMADRCKCGTLKPYFNNWCSLSCKSKYTGGNWAKNPETLARQKKLISENMKKQYKTGQRDPYSITKKANEKTRQMFNDGTHPFQDANKRGNGSMMGREARMRISNRMKKDNPMFDRESAKKARKSQAAFYLKNPDKHPNRVMAKNGHRTWIEECMAKLLDVLGIEYLEQHPIDKFFVDFALPEQKIIIETDGEYWHQDKEKDANRDLILESHGWDVFHFTDKRMQKDLGSVKNEVCRLVNNHDGQYEFIEIKIKRIESWQIKKARTLYNFSVEDDESYIAKGFVVHNCRSTTVPVLKSWRELGIDRDDKLDGRPPKPEGFDEWLKKQSPSVQDKLLGPVRAGMWRDGKVANISGFVDNAGGTIPLEDFGLNRDGTPIKV